MPQAEPEPGDRSSIRWNPDLWIRPRGATTQHKHQRDQPRDQRPSVRLASDPFTAPVAIRTSGRAALDQLRHPHAQASEVLGVVLAR